MMKKKTEMVLRRSRDQTPCEKLRMQQETQGMNVYVVRERDDTWNWKKEPFCQLAFLVIFLIFRNINKIRANI